MHVVSAKASANECREFGQQLRKQLDSDNRPQGLLIVADGASTLTAKAPGSFDERAAGVQSAIDDALTAGDPEALLALDPQLCRSVGARGARRGRSWPVSLRARLGRPILARRSTTAMRRSASVTTSGRGGRERP